MRMTGLRKVETHCCGQIAFIAFPRGLRVDCSINSIYVLRNLRVGGKTKKKKRDFFRRSSTCLECRILVILHLWLVLCSYPPVFSFFNGPLN